MKQSVHKKKVQCKCPLLTQQQVCILEHELIQLDDYDEKRVEYGLCGYHNTFDTFGPFVFVEFE